MKKITLLIIALFGLGLLFDSCIDNDKIDELNDELLYQVTEIEAYAIAEKLLYLDRTKTYPTNEVSMENFTVRKKVKDIQTIMNDDEEDIMHVVNYQNGGFVIIAADKRMPAILAHSEFGEFAIEEDIVDNTGIIYWISEMVVEKELAQSGSYDKDFQNYVESTWVKSRDNPRPVNVACPNGTVIYDTLVDFPTWNQRNPYNLRLDYINCNNSRIQPVTGCAATAVGQVLKSLFDYGKFNGKYRYFQNPEESLDWSNMPTLPYQDYDSQIATFMRHFGKAANSNYECSGGTSTRTDKTVDFLRNNCNFNPISRSPSSTIIINDLQDRKPVLMHGQDLKKTYKTITIRFGSRLKKFTLLISVEKVGHIWSIKGIKNLQNCNTRNPNTNIYYMDWGWGGRNNGWFWIGADHHRFAYERGIIYNLGK